MLNVIWSLLVIVSVVCSFLFGKSENLSAAMVDSGADAVELLLTLAGILTLWSGIMKIAEKSGLTTLLARLSAPLLRLLFPALDKDGEAFGFITMNLTANLLGLGTTATPLGLRPPQRSRRHSERRNGHLCCDEHGFSPAASYDARFAAAKQRQHRAV